MLHATEQNNTHTHWGHTYIHTYIHRISAAKVWSGEKVKQPLRAEPCVCIGRHTRKPLVAYLVKHWKMLKRMKVEKLSFENHCYGLVVCLSLLWEKVTYEWVGEWMNEMWCFYKLIFRIQIIYPEQYTILKGKVKVICFVSLFYIRDFYGFEKKWKPTTALKTHSIIWQNVRNLHAIEFCMVKLLFKKFSTTFNFTFWILYVLNPLFNPFNILSCKIPKSLILI